MRAAVADHGYDGPIRVYELLHTARAVLIDLDQRAIPLAPGSADRLRTVEARYDGTWELPVLGAGADALCFLACRCRSR